MRSLARRRLRIVGSSVASKMPIAVSPWSSRSRTSRSARVTSCCPSALPNSKITLARETGTSSRTCSDVIASPEP